ncbi:hypothetical protein L6R52_23010 [Myxococcota bacterium]|nr:hypothetical protein [Myxococcota bacterium]
MGTVARLALTGLTAITLACAGSTQSGGTRTAFTSPAWFTQPPKHSDRTLYFVGDASGQTDEGTARDLAIQKALSELTVFCGATVKSDARSTLVEKNGQEQYEVSLSVDVAGDELTVREAVVTKTELGRGSDGRFDAYVLVEWPRAQYENVLAMQRDRAARALALYLTAEGAAKELDTAAARTSLGEAKGILGPMKSSVPLQHAEHKNTALLWDAMKALEARLDAADASKKGTLAVAVECLRDAKVVPCAATRAGALRQALSKVGKKVSADAVPAGVASGILSSESPTVDRSVRAAGYVVAVRYSAELQAVDGPFTFVRTSARGVVFDTSTGKIVAVEEIAPEKQGHPTYEGAMEKGFGAAEKRLAGWVEATAAKLD